mgnify:CR=1 FL=1
MKGIPENAKKVFDGIIFDAYHFELERYDGSKAVFEKLKRATTLITLPVVGDKIVMVRDSQPHRDTMWGLPGGRQDGGESELEGAQLEFNEETGYSSKNWSEIRRYTPYSKIDWEIVFFLARDCTKVAEPDVDPGEKIEVYEKTFDEFIEIVCGPEFHERDFALEVMRLRLEGRLDELKKEIFG